MKHILHELFLSDCIDAIQKKFQEIVKPLNEQYFSYANIFQAPLYYKLFTFSKNVDYGLYNKVLESKHYEVIECLIKAVSEEHYKPSLLLLLYSYICEVVLNYYIEDYILYQCNFKRLNTKKLKMEKYSKTIKNIEAQFYKDRFYTPISKHKVNLDQAEIDEECYKAINLFCSKVYYFSFGAEIFKKGYSNFIKYQDDKYNGIKLFNVLSTKFLDSITRSKKYSASSIFYTHTPTKKDYLNKQNKLWINKNTECYKSFTALYEEAIETASKLMSLASDEIFYKLPKTNEIKKVLAIIKK